MFIYFFGGFYCNFSPSISQVYRNQGEKINSMTWKNSSRCSRSFPLALYASPTLIKCIRGVDGEMLERTPNGFGLFKGFVAEM